MLQHIKWHHSALHHNDTFYKCSQLNWTVSAGVQSCPGHTAHQLPVRLIRTKAGLGYQVWHVRTHTHKHTPNTLQASPDSPLFVTVGLLTSSPTFPIFLFMFFFPSPTPFSSFSLLNGHVGLTSLVDFVPTDSLRWKYLLYEMDAPSQIEMSPGPALVPCLINISLPYENRKLSLSTDVPRCCGCGTSSRILHQKSGVFLSAMDKA